MVAISGRLTHKVYETLGQEAGEDLVNWMHGIDAQRWEFRELHETSTARFEARLGEAVAQLRSEMVTMKTELQVGLSKLETTIERRYASLLRWSFLFWIGSVATVIGAVVTLQRMVR